MSGFEDRLQKVNEKNNKLKDEIYFEKKGRDRERGGEKKGRKEGR